MKRNRKVIIKSKAGEMGHMDCHRLSQSIIKDKNDKLYLVCLIDDYSRIAWAEIITDVTSLSVMFAALKCFNFIVSRYQIKFSEILTDNGPEFGTKSIKDKSKTLLNVY